MAEPSRKPIRFGLYEVDVASGELRKSGVKVRLQEQPFQVLVALLERPGEVVTREDLRQRLWPADTFVDFDHSLNTAINKLRDALGDTASNARFIETLARRGYRFIAPVQSGIGEAAASAPVAETPASAELPADELPRPHRGMVRTLFLLIQVMYLVFYIVALARLERVYEIAALEMGNGTVVVVVAVISAVIAIPMRLYLWTAVAFDYRLLGEKFRRLFPVVFVVDEIWALSPLLIGHKIGLGLALAACAALLYLPFSQRTLMRMGYPVARRQPAVVSQV
ncbi:MAG: winged helix-turn-helix domain-containing protein [Acidobacteriia bacterium]|nr:winged helix-turn-helix domain-containing protein [Terriglobia bacterium]